MFKSGAIRSPDMMTSDYEDGHEDRQYSNAVLPDITADMKVNAAPSFNSKSKRFGDQHSVTDAVTYLDDLVQPPNRENASWMFKPPSSRSVPHAVELDQDRRDYGNVPEVLATTGVKFPVAARFPPVLFPEEKPGPGAYDPDLDRGNAALFPKDKRFKDGEINDAPYYTIPGLADESEQTSRQAHAAGLGFGSTNLRFDEEDEFDE